MLRILFLLSCFLMLQAPFARSASKGQDEQQDPLKTSGAEIIIRFQKFIASDQQRLIKMKSRSNRLEQEIAELTLQFERLDGQSEVAGSPSREKDMDQLLNSLDLRLRSRQAIQQQITIVQNKVEKQKEVVNYLTIGQPPVIEHPVNLVPSSADTVVQSGSNSERQNRIELESLEELQRLEAELLNARQNLLMVDQLTRMNKGDLELTKVLTEASVGLMALLASQPQDQGVRQQQLEILRRYSQDTILISALKVRINDLEAFKDPMIKVVSEAAGKVDRARTRLEFLQSSVAPHRVIHWLKSNLPKIGVILLVFFAIWIACRWVIKLILNRMIKARAVGESADRLETLKLASGSIITILVVFGGLIVLLPEVGVDLAVVLGGAAVLSLVIAFGAQSLVKDYLSGFMILLENQYRAGNVVKINHTTGVVENMSLRLTVLRDLEGVTHFIPHGQILDVSNLTHLWSRAMFDIGVSYNENIDEVIGVLKELGAEMKADPEYSDFVIEDMEMLGVDKFSESAIVIKFLVKTRPLKQWIVKRELLRRIKNRFDELGIEIPFPHLTVYHRDLNKKSPDSLI